MSSDEVPPDLELFPDRKQAPQSTPPPVHVAGLDRVRLAQESQPRGESGFRAEPVRRVERSESVQPADRPESGRATETIAGTRVTERGEGSRSTEAPADPVVARLAAIEELLREIRNQSDLRARDDQHAEFTAWRYAAAIAQGLAFVLLVWCGFEFAFVVQEGYASIAMKLLFALILQLLTATILLAERSGEP